MLVEKQVLVKRKEEVKSDVLAELGRERVDYAYSLKRAGYFGNFLLEGRVTEIEEQEDRDIFRCQMTLDPMGSKWIDFARAKYRPQLFEVFLIRAKDWNNNAKWHCFIWDEFSKKELAKKKKEEELEIKKNLDVYNIENGHYEFSDQENLELLRKIELEGESETPKERFDSFIRRNKPLKHGDGRRHKILQRDQYETLGLFKDCFGFSCFEEQNITAFLSARKVNVFRFKFRGLSPLKYCFPVFNRNVSFFLLKKLFGFSRFKKLKLRLKSKSKLKVRIPNNLFAYQTIRFLPLYSSLQETKICLVGGRKGVLLNNSDTFSFVSAWLSWKFLFTCVVLGANKDYRARRDGYYSLSKISQLRTLLKINNIFKDSMPSVAYYDYLRKLISLPVQTPFDAFVVGCCVSSEDDVSFSFSQFGYSHRFRTYFLVPRKRIAKPLSSIANFNKSKLLGRPAHFFRYSSKLWLSSFIYHAAVRNSSTVELVFGKKKNRALRWVDFPSVISKERFDSRVKQETSYLNRLHNIVINYSKNSLLHKLTNLFGVKRCRPLLANKKKFKLFNRLQFVNQHTYKNKLMLNKKCLLSQSNKKNLVVAKQNLVSNQIKKKKNMFKNQVIARSYSFLAKSKTYELSTLRRPVRVSLNFLEKSLLKNSVIPRSVLLGVCSQLLGKEKLACLDFAKLDSMSFLFRSKSFFPNYAPSGVLRRKKNFKNSRRPFAKLQRLTSFKAGVLRESPLSLPWFCVSSSSYKENTELPRLRYLSKRMYLNIAVQKYICARELKGLKRDLFTSLRISKKWTRQNKKNSKYTTNPYWNNRSSNYGKNHPRWRDVTFGRIFTFPTFVLSSTKRNDSRTTTKSRISSSLGAREMRIKRTYPRGRLSYRTKYVLGRQAGFFYRALKFYKNFSVAGRYNSFMNYLRIQKFYDNRTAYPMVRLIAASKGIDKLNTKNWEEWNRIKQTWYAYKKQQRKQRRFNNFKHGNYNHTRNYKHDYTYSYKYGYKQNRNYKYDYNRSSNDKRNQKHSYSGEHNYNQKQNYNNSRKQMYNHKRGYKGNHNFNFNQKSNNFRGKFNHGDFNRNNQFTKNTQNNSNFKHPSNKINQTQDVLHKQKFYGVKNSVKVDSRVGVNFTKKFESKVPDKPISHKEVDRRHYKDFGNKRKLKGVRGASSEKFVGSALAKKSDKNSFRAISGERKRMQNSFVTTVKSNSKLVFRGNKAFLDTKSDKRIPVKTKKISNKVSSRDTLQQTRGVGINLSLTKSRPVQNVKERRFNEKLENKNKNKNKK